MYFIKKNHLYVAMPGSANSYTTNPENAVRYPTQEEAKRNACGNETIVKAELTYK